MIHAKQSLLCGMLLLSALFALAGCRQSPATTDDMRLARLAVYFGRFISQHEGKPPANEQEFKEFIKKLEPEANIEELFVSPRDKEAYVVRYGPRVAMGTAEVTAYEKTGVGGKRMVALSTGEVRTVDETQFQELLGKSP